MRLIHLQNRQVVIARRVPTANDKLVYTTVTVEMMHIQPVADSSSEIREGTFGKQFRIYVDGGIDLKQGDRLRDTDDGNEYTVMADGISRRTMGSIDYSIVVVQKTK